MSKVIFDISMSLDGFIAGTNAQAGEGWTGLGDGGQRLHDWVFNIADPLNLKVVESWADTGAIIVGRTTYNHSILNWGADGPMGDVRLSTIVISHSVPQDIPDGGVYTFVDSIEAAFETAKKAAGDKNIGMMGGNIAQQFIALGLVDEIIIHLVPVLFGAGTRLIEDLCGRHVQLETTEVLKTKEAIHLRFRVIK